MAVIAYIRQNYIYGIIALNSKKQSILTPSIAILIFLSLLASAPVQSSDEQDPVCAPLQEFVASVQPGQNQEFIFRTIWGGNFKGASETVLGAKRCEHNNYAPGVAACRALIKYGAVEFSANNAKRVILCLSPKTQFDPGLQFKRGEFSLSYGNEERGSSITLKYGEDASIGGMALRLTAHGY